MNPAHAEPTDAEKETARSLMDDGDRLRAAQNHEAALQRYQAAHEIMNVPTTGIEVARTYASLGKLVEARRTALEVANLPPLVGEASVMGEARSAASQLATSLATRIPAAVIQVSPREAQASIVVDGVQLPASVRGLPYRTNPGEHVVQVSAPGYQTTEQRFTLQEGVQTPVSIALVAAAPPPPVPPAPVPATTPPTTTQSQLVAGSGPAPTPDQDTTPPATPAEPRESYAVTAFSLAGISAVVGGVAGLVSLSATSSAKKHCEGNICSREAKDDIDSARTWAGVSNVGFGLAIGMGIWGLVEVLSDTDDSPAPSTEVGRAGSKLSFALSPNQASAVLQGSF